MTRKSLQRRPQRQGIWVHAPRGAVMMMTVTMTLAITEEKLRRHALNGWSTDSGTYRGGAGVGVATG